MDIHNLVSFSGIFILLGVAWLISGDKKNMNFRLIFWAIALQIIFAVFIFVIPVGAKTFLIVNDVVVKVLESATAGAKFVFGPLAIAPGQTNEEGEKSIGFILAFQAFPTIIFFSALISILYYLKIMPLILRGFSFVFTKLMKISGAESLVAASNIFVGVEANLAVKPYLAKMTRSEFCTILTAGMATVASNVLALYVIMLRPHFENIAGHLVSASLLSAPAAVVMSKIILPERDKPETLGIKVQPYYQKDNSLFEAVINGSYSGVKMIVGITALLIAVLGLVSLLDIFLSAFGSGLNSLFGLELDLSLKTILGYIFYPFTLVIGVHPSDAGIISKIIGERIIVTEVVSYQDLAKALELGQLQNKRSAFLATYALCGFAHFASMAIFVGGISALTRQRTKDLASVAFRALIAATLACLLTACVAGTFFTEKSILLGN